MRWMALTMEAHARDAGEDTPLWDRAERIAAALEDHDLLSRTIQQRMRHSRAQDKT